MRITNMAMAKDYLLSLGFQEKDASVINYPINWGNTFCWFEGRRRKGAEPPSLVIQEKTGIIYMHMTHTYYRREIPSVLFKLLEDLDANGILERSDLEWA